MKEHHSTSSHPNLLACLVCIQGRENPSEGLNEHKECNKDKLSSSCKLRRKRVEFPERALESTQKDIGEVRTSKFSI
jgi:hypothetical protein